MGRGLLRDGAGNPLGLLTVPDDATPEVVDQLATQALITFEAQKIGVPVDLALALAEHESRFDQSRVSPKGARGVFQLMPETAKALGVDPDDKHQNIQGGLRYLAEQLRDFGREDLALAAYNAGPGAVRKHGGIPPFAETQFLVRDVGKRRAAFPLMPAGGTEQGGTPAPGLLEGLIESAPEDIAATVGQMGGTAVGAPLGPVAATGLGLAGAGLGGGVAGGVQAALRGEPVLPAAGAAALRQVGFGAAGAAIAPAIRGTRALIFRAPKPEVREAVEFFARTAPRRGAPLLAIGELTQSRAYEQLEAIARSSAFGRERLAEVGMNLQTAIHAAQDDLLDQFGKGASLREVGDAVQHALGAQLDAARLSTQGLYNTIDEAMAPVAQQVTRVVTPAKQVPGAVLDASGRPVMQTIPAVTETVEELVGPMVRVDEARQFAEPLRRASDALGGMAGAAYGDSFIRDVARLSEEGLHFPIAQELRSRLLNLRRTLEKSGIRTPALGRVKVLIGRIDEAMEETLAATRPDLISTWREANALTKANAEKLQNRFIAGLLRLGTRGSVAGTEAFANATFKRGSETQAQRLWAALGNDEVTKDRVRRVFAAHLFRLSQDATGEVSGRRLTRLLNDAERGFRETAGVILPAAQRSQLARFARGLTAIEEAKSKRAKVSPAGFQLARAAAVVGVLTGRITRAALTVLVAPSIAARMVTSPKQFALLTRATRADARTGAGALLATRLAGEVARLTLSERADDATRAATLETPPTPVPQPTPQALAR